MGFGFGIDDWGLGLGIGEWELRLGIEIGGWGFKLGIGIEQWNYRWGLGIKMTIDIELILMCIIRLQLLLCFFEGCVVAGLLKN